MPRIALVVTCLLAILGVTSAAGAQPLPPTPGGVAGSVLWVKGDADVQVDAGNQVEQWLDQSGSGNTVTELRAAHPAHTSVVAPSSAIVLVPNGINFNPAVDFNGSLGKSLKGNAASTWTSGPLSIFAVSVMEGAQPSSIGAVWTSHANWTTGGGGTAGAGLASTPSGYALDGNGCLRAPTTSPGTQPRVLRGIYVTGTNALNGSTWVDGAQEGTGTNCGNVVTTFFEVGGRTAGASSLDSRIFSGKIAEVVVFKSLLSAADAEKVDSYLALKYGVTLKHSYLASNGATVYWDMAANAAYHHDVAGVGRDDGAGLLQKQSASVNPDNFLTIGHGVIAADNASNPNGFAADSTFFAWGHDGADPSAFDLIDKPAGYDARVLRVWKAANVGSVTDLAVQFTLPPFIVESGDAADYALLVSNTPDFASATPITGVLAGQTISFTGVDIADGQFFTLAVPLPPPDVQIVKSVSGATVLPGETYTYKLTITNNGPSTADNVVATDVLPGEVVFDSAGPGCTASGQTVTCTAGDLVDGATVSFDVIVRLLPAYGGDGSDIFNSATVTLDDPDPLPNNNTSPAGAPPVGPGQADVAIVKDVSPGDVLPGGQFAYTILVSNQGPSSAAGVVVTDVLPDGVTFVSSPDGCALGVPPPTTSRVATLDAASQTVTCPTLPSMGPGASQTYTLIVTLGATYRGDGSDLPNAASVAAVTPDPVPGNNTNPPVFPQAVNPFTDIAVGASASTPTTVPGDVVTVTISAQNLGPLDATGLLVTAPLPPGTTLESVPPEYDPGTGQWTIGALPHGGQAALALKLRIADAGPVALTATRAALDQIDGNAGNDTATAALTAKFWSTFEADLVLDASTSPAVAEPGGVLTYALVGVNRGPTYVVDLRIDGEVPAGTTFEAVTPSAGGVCTTPAVGSAGLVQCTWPGSTLLDTGASRLAQLQVRVGAEAAPGSSITGAFHVSSLTGEYYEPSNHAVVVTAVSDGTEADLALSGLMLSEGVLGTALPLPLGVPTPLRFTVTNLGPTPTSGARYTVSIPETDIAGVEIVSAAVSQGAVALVGPSAADWQVGPLGPGESAAFDLTVSMHSMRATTLEMRRVESLPGDPNSANDTATLTIDGTGDPDGGERTAAIGNLDGVGLKEVVVGAGRFETPQVRIFSGDGQDTGLRFYAYDRNFVGGVRVATCDIDGDGIDEIVTAPGIGPGPHVRVMRLAGQSVDEVVGFYAFDPAFVGGVSIACADVNNDNRAEVIAGMDFGGAEVRVFAVGPDFVAQTASFHAYEESFLGGVRVAALAANEPGGSQYQIVTVPGPGRPLELRAWAVGDATAAMVRTVSLTGPEYQLGAFVDVADIDNDGQTDAVVATDRGVSALVGALTIDSGQFIGTFEPFGPGFFGGARVTLGDIDANGQAELLISQGPGGRPIVDAYTLGNPVSFVYRITSIEIP